MEAFLYHLFSILGFALAIVLAVRLLRENRPPGSTIAWLLAILLMPYVGVPLYILIGGRKIRKLTGDKGPLYPTTLPEKREVVPHNDTERILRACGAPPSSVSNRLELLTNGEVTFERLLQLIRGARRSIHVTTFILGADEVGRAIVEELTALAARGVEVRLLLDSLGCLKTRGRFVAPLRAAGGKVGVFLPMLPLRRKWSANLRNHRKMIIVDGHTAVIGGMNLAREYMGPGKDEERWSDFAMSIEGEAVRDVGRIFASDWHFATGEWLTEEAEPPVPAGKSPVQVVASGPDVANDPFYQALLAAFHEARERVWIVTPYFIPDDAITKALGVLARLGRDVRIIMPAKSNHALADLARGSYMRQLAEVGVRFFGYRPGMLHTKLIVVDDAIAVVGSANMDIRSLYLNFEIAAFLYGSEDVAHVAENVRAIALQASPFADARAGFRTGLREWVEDASRILAPLL